MVTFVLNATSCDTVDCMCRVPQSTIRDTNKLIMAQNPPAGGSLLFLALGFTMIVFGQPVSDLLAGAFGHGNLNEGIKKLVVCNTTFQVSLSICILMYTLERADKLQGLGLFSDYKMPFCFPDFVRAHVPNASNRNIATLQSMHTFAPDLPEKLAWDHDTDAFFGPPRRTSQRHIKAGYSWARSQLFLLRQ
ncbi:hypothetical protein P171DRAFT_488555 [Karstenula rhodostoma CBS 690.94]|uniref:Uncharacterized protein n=1 Tax=Karstenula rhodostoma CBS 690.94 TaxID=1392251 RepID=A0A9P4U9E6_9PLEO|nr:hypothetical protein P171DRAFT_488555 [Karstenula rhodostoma CBS 690.94]